MFKVNTKQWGIVEIRFIHHNPKGEYKLGLDYGTYCEIIAKNNNPVIGGKSILHPLDHSSFCKETGRKIALRRTLEASGLNKRARGAVWATYFATQEKHRSNQVTRTLYEREAK